MSSSAAVKQALSNALGAVGLTLRMFVRGHPKQAALVLVTALLAVYVLVVDRGSVTSQEIDVRKNRLVIAWRIDEITRVDVVLRPPNAPQQAYVLTRAAKTANEVRDRPWNLELDGTLYPAEEQVVDSLLFGFDRSRILREVPQANVDRAGFGLAEPRARYVITMGDITHDIAIGGVAASQEGHYVEVAGRGVFVISRSDVQQMNVPPDELRSRTVVPYLSTQLDALHIDGEGGARKFERAPWKGGRASGFRFADGSEGPKGRRVDSHRLDQVLVSLGKIQAQKFLDQKVADPLSKPRVTITLVPKEGDNGVLEVGGDCPDEPELTIVVRRSPGYLAACVPQGIIASLVRPASDFIDDGMVGASVAEITDLRIERGDKILEVAPSGTGFLVRKPKETVIDPEVGNHLLSDIVEARGEIAPDDATMPDGPITKMRVVSQFDNTKDTRVEEIEVGPEVEGKHLVIRKEDGAKLYLGAGAANALQPSDLLLRSTAVVGRKSIDLVELSVTHEGERQAFTHVEQALTLVEPTGKGLQVDRANANRATGAVAGLTALRWVAEEAQPSFGLDEPRFVIKAKFGASDDDDAETLELKLGGLTDDGVYASISSETGVFLVARSFEEAFDRSFIARDAFKLDPGAADRLEVDVNGTIASLTRDGRQLRWKGKPDARAAELEKQLVELDAIFAVGAGSPAKEQGFDAPTVKIIITPRKSPQDAEDPKRIVVAFGAGGSVEGVPVRYARRDDVDATYAVPHAAVKRIEELVGGK